jgi:hypothetical protein
VRRLNVGTKGEGPNEVEAAGLQHHEV